MTNELALWALLAALLAGAGFGAAYFALLRRGAAGFVRAAQADGGGTGWLLAGFALRLALTLAALALAIRLGAGAAELLAAALGFTLARQVAIRRRPREG